MKLKDAFRYKHVLSGWLDEAATRMYDGYCYRITEDHRKNEVVPELKSELVDRTPIRDMDATQVFEFVVKLVGEYEALSFAIDQAMSEQCSTYKATVDTARIRRQAAAMFSTLAQKRATEERTTDTATYINSAGVASPFTYPVIRRQTPVMEPKTAQIAAKKFLSQADAMSEQIDLALVTIDVDFTPNFDVNDTFLFAARSAGIAE